jgi:hypothetical protein
VVTDVDPGAEVITFGHVADGSVHVNIVPAETADGRRPTEFIVGDSDAGTEVPLEDGLVWAALHQDAIVVRLPDGSGPLAGQPVAALLRRG